MAKSAQMAVEKYKRNVAAAGPAYAAGVQNPKRPWLQAYTQSAPRMYAGLQAAIASGKMVKQASARGGDQHWQSNALNKGAANYTNAASMAGDAYAAKAEKVIAAGQQASQAAAALPNTTYEQREQRMLAASRAQRKYWGKG